jgi:riboflavin biosynthesis pyrimidine reductase
MYRRWADGAQVTAAEALAEADLRSLAGEDRPHVVFNFVSTLDGRAALDGSTKPLGGPGDLEMLLSLRAAVDAVLIGPGTVRAEGYARLVKPPRREDTPPAVLISRRFELPWEAGLFAAPDQPVLIYTGRDTAASVPSGVAAPVEVVQLPDPTPGAVLRDLRARGVRALLSEGGPTLFRAFAAAGLVDELFLTLAPLLTGDGDELSILEGGRLPGLARFRLAWVLRAEENLFLRYRAVR